MMFSRICTVPGKGIFTLSTFECYFIFVCRDDGVVSNHRLRTFSNQFISMLFIIFCDKD